MRRNFLSEGYNPDLHKNSFVEENPLYKPSEASQNPEVSFPVDPYVRDPQEAKYCSIDGGHRLYAMRRLWKEDSVWRKTKMQVTVMENLTRAERISLSNFLNRADGMIVVVTAYDEVMKMKSC